MILTRTPLRVSLFGGGSDYPAWFMEEPGAVLGMAINKYVYVGVKPLPPGQLLSDGMPIRYRVQYSKVDDCRTVAEIKHPAVRAALQYLRVDTPLEFHVFGDLPGRSGLGGSSSFTVGCLHALLTLLKIPLPGTLLDLGREAIALEQFVIHEAVGMQDQILASVGGVNHITFSASGSYVTPVDVPLERLRELEASLVLVYSGGMRDAHVMAEKQIARVRDNWAVLQEMVSMVQAGRRVLENPAIPLAVIGTMLDRAWGLKRTLTPEISSPDIDALYARGCNLGAVGGKLLGAGGGGYMLFYVHAEDMGYFVENINAPLVRFGITRVGSIVLIND